MSSLFSASTRPSFASTDKVSVMKERASAILAEKDAEIARLNRELDEVERMFDSGLQAGVDEDAEMKAEVARLEVALKNMEFRADTEIQSLKEQQADEVRELEAKHKKELDKLYKELDRVSESQSGLRRQQVKAATMSERVGRDEREKKELQEARQRAVESQHEVERLEAELKQMKNEQQKQILEQARFVKEREERRKAEVDKKRSVRQAHTREQVAALKAELKKESDAMKEKLQRVIERNQVLDCQLAAALADNEEKPSTSRSKKSSSRTKRTKSPRKKTKRRTHDSTFAEFSVVEAEIVRLRDENEELRQIIKRLDKLAYVSEPR